MFLSSNCTAQHPPPPPPHQTHPRPSWAAPTHDHSVTKETAKSMLCLARWNAGIRPGPARSAVPQMSAEALRASQRSHRSAPSKWSQPLSAEYDATAQQEMYSGLILGLKWLNVQESGRLCAVCDPIRNVLPLVTQSWVHLITIRVTNKMYVWLVITQKIHFFYDGLNR